jgi:hypothetical protein
MIQAGWIREAEPHEKVMEEDNEGITYDKLV